MAPSGVQCAVVAVGRDDALAPSRARGGQHPEPPAEIRVPHVVRAIDGHPEGASAVAGDAELGHPPVTEPTEPTGTELREPDGAIGGGRECDETGGRCGDRKFVEAPVGKSPDLIEAELDEPHRPGPVDDDVTEATLTRRHVELDQLAIRGEA